VQLATTHFRRGEIEVQCVNDATHLRGQGSIDVPSNSADAGGLLATLPPNGLIIARSSSRFSPGGTMAKDHGNSVKNDRKYEALRDKGYSKERSAKIANSGKKSSRKGGKHSH